MKKSETLPRCKKGFTLIELFIVIVVIGILSAITMISSTEAVSSARVAAVISDMRNLETAIVSWCEDNNDKIKVNTESKDGNRYNVYLVRWENINAPVQEFWESRTTAQGITTFKAEVLKYMENPGGVRSSATGWDKSSGKQKIEDAVSNGYVLEDNGSAQKRNQWFIGYVVKGDDKMKKKFAAHANTFGLWQSNSENAAPYTDGDVVWMRILSFE